MGAWRLSALVAGVGLACVGPRVDVSTVVVHPRSDGLVRVEAQVRNRGGAGEVKVTVRLRERSSSGRTFSATRHVDVRERETVNAIVDVPAPPGAYDAAVTAVFPPD